MLELARPSDREAVNALARQVHELHVAWRPDIYEMPEELYPEDRFLRVIAQRQLYVEKVDGVVAGYMLLVIRERKEPGLIYRKIMRMEEICVDEVCRNQGFGTRMVLEARALARAFGCTDIQLGVYPQNDEAVGFYQKCGFTIRSIEMQTKI